MSPSHAKHAFRLLTGPHFILLHQEGPPQMQSSLHLPLFPYLCQTVQFLKHLCWEAEQAMPQGLISEAESAASADSREPQDLCRLCHCPELQHDASLFPKPLLCSVQVYKGCSCFLLGTMSRAPGML